jgi:hypothetical protein
LTVKGVSSTALLAPVVEVPLVGGAAVWADICTAHKARRQEIRVMIFMGARMFWSVGGLAAKSPYEK